MQIEPGSARIVRLWQEGLGLSDQDAAQAVGIPIERLQAYKTGPVVPDAPTLRAMELTTAITIAIADLRKGQAHKARTALERQLTVALEHAARRIGPPPVGVTW